MSARKTTRRTTSTQMELSFFDVPPTPRPEAGGLDVALAVRETLADMLGTVSSRGIDRHEVAAQISRLSNYETTKNMLDRYCAPSAEGWRFPAEAIPALTVATGDYRMLEMLADRCGCRVYRGEEAMLAEIGALTLQERSVKARLGELRKNVPDTVMDRLVDEVVRRLGGRAQ
ncbi:MULTISPECIES: phage regulatory CII family protein [unclassified Burkholderia]|uniref:phage regulatory CII family protein n=1 Tax=unclassified Burkholderia TaxID=2613784 RepID=UPI000B02191B|nr:MULTISPECIES: phage regulatory CII family protein [unclassified Burkholderia]